MLLEETKNIDDGEGKDPLLTTKEVAGILGIHQNTVRRWSDMGVIKSFRISRRGDRRYKYEDITGFLDGMNIGSKESEARGSE